MNLPKSVKEWNKEIIVSFIEMNYKEDQIIEFKSFLEPTNNEKENKQNLQKEMCIFANAKSFLI